MVSPWRTLQPEQKFKPGPGVPTITSALCPSRGLRDTVLFRLSASQPLDIRCRPRILQVKASGVMEGPMLSPLFADSPINKQQVMSLLDIRALIHGDPWRFSVAISIIDGYGGQTVTVMKVSLRLQTGRSPPREYEVFLSPVSENILGLISYKVKLCKPVLVSSTLGFGYSNHC